MKIGTRVFVKDLGVYGTIKGQEDDVYILTLDGDRWAAVPEEQVAESPAHD